MRILSNVRIVLLSFVRIGFRVLTRAPYHTSRTKDTWCLVVSTMSSDRRGTNAAEDQAG